jgi:hypothetical protein
MMFKEAAALCRGEVKSASLKARILAKYFPLSTLTKWASANKPSPHPDFELLAGLAVACENRNGRMISKIASDLGPRLTITSEAAYHADTGFTVKFASKQASSAPRTGIAAIKARLEALTPEKLEAEAKELLASRKKTARPRAIALLNMAEGMKRTGVKPSDFLISKVPVIPPKFRPFLVQGDRVSIGDANELYRDLMHARDAHKELAELLGTENAAEAGLRVQDAVSAVFGFGEAVNPKTKKREVKGFLHKIVGDGPKFGWVNSKMLAKPVDNSARGVIIPDPDLTLNQVGLPKDMLWDLYGAYVQGRMVRAGYPVAAALQKIKDRSQEAYKFLEMEMKERPVVYARAPSWHKFNVIGGNPVAVEGDAIRISPHVAAGLNADFDGDQNLGAAMFLVEAGFENNLNPANVFLKAFTNKGLTKKQTTEMFKNTNIKIKDNESVYIADLEDFPRYLAVHNSVEGKKGRIDFHEVPEGVFVAAYDAEKGKLRWAPVKFWSKHYQRDVEIVRLSNGMEIFTDDDPRAIYGIEDATDTLLPKRYTPHEAIRLRVAVPVANIGDSLNRAKEIEMPWGDVWRLDFDFGYLFGALRCRLSDKMLLQKHIKLNATVRGNSSPLKRISWLADYFKSRLGATVSVTEANKKVTATGGCVAEFVQWFLTQTRGSETETRGHLPLFFRAASVDFRKGLLAGIIDFKGEIDTLQFPGSEQPCLRIQTGRSRFARELTELIRSLNMTHGLTAAEGKPWVITLTQEDLLSTDILSYVMNEAVVDEFSKGTFHAPRKRIKPESSVVFPRVIREALAPFAEKLAGVLPCDAHIIPRETAERVLKTLCRFPEALPVLASAPMREFSLLVQAKEVDWVAVETVTVSGQKEDGYDLTVPGYETFMSAEGVILSNTINVHVPALRESVEEVKNKLMPDKMLHSVKDFKSVVPVPKHEATAGLYESFDAPAKRTHRFKTSADALKAYEAGEISASDEVELDEDDTESGRTLPALNQAA